MGTGGTGLERVMGIEPTPPAWKAGALPLSYTRIEPQTRWRRTKIGKSERSSLLILAWFGSDRSRPARLLASLARAARRGGGGRIRTYVRVRGQIYSLLPLTTRPPLQDALECRQTIAPEGKGGREYGYCKSFVNRDGELPPGRLR
jgi:hypothetical protein